MPTPVQSHTGTGLDGSLGLAKEGTYADPAAVPTRFFEWLTANLGQDRNTFTSKGINSGRQMAAASKRAIVTTAVKGDLSLEVPSSMFGLIFEALMGKVTPTAPSPQGDTAYSYAYTLGAQPSLMVQQNVPFSPDSPLLGSLESFNYRGVMVTSAEFSCATSGVLTAKVSCLGQSMDHSTVTTPNAVYADGATLFSFAGGTVTVDGTVAATLSDFGVTVDRKLDNARYFFGGSGKPAKAAAKDLTEVSVKTGIQFDDVTLLTKWSTDASVAITATFVGQPIAGSTKKSSVTFTIPVAKIDGDLVPGLTGPDVVKLSPTFTAMVGAAGTEPLTITYVTADTAS